MPMYQWKCKRCGGLHEAVFDREEKVKIDEALKEEAKCGHEYQGRSCQGEIRPYYGSIQFGSVMHSHFNLSTNSVISDDKQFDRELRMKSEMVSERTNIPHDFQRVDLHDKAALGVTDEGMKATHDRQVSTGEKPATARLV